jgi:hypothetical protein
MEYVTGKGNFDKLIDMMRLGWSGLLIGLKEVVPKEK